MEAANDKYEAGQELLEFVLQAQQRTADADSAYSQALVDYNASVADMHVNRGTYLQYMGVHLSEGPWSPEHYRSYRKEFRRFKPRMDYCMGFAVPCQHRDIQSITTNSTDSDHVEAEYEYAPIDTSMSESSLQPNVTAEPGAPAEPRETAIVDELKSISIESPASTRSIDPGASAPTTIKFDDVPFENGTEK